MLAFSNSSDPNCTKPIRSSGTAANAMEASRPSGIGAPTSRSNTRQFVSSLISAIPAEAAVPSPNPMKDVPPATKSIFLTLYALFEKEWLPALDLLDRGLVTRLKLKAASHEEHSLPKRSFEEETGFFLVRSAQQNSTRNASFEHINYYEVRLKAWSCSCPAFTFAAFPASISAPDTGDLPISDGSANVIFGGVTLGTDMPVCKHLLACVLVEHCQMFAQFVDEREATLEELAGWVAGWGD